MSCAQRSAWPKADAPARDHFLSADSRESSRISPMERSLRRDGRTRS